MMPNETTNTPILTLDSDAKLETALPGMRSRMPTVPAGS